MSEQSSTVCSTSSLHMFAPLNQTPFRPGNAGCYELPSANVCFLLAEGSQMASSPALHLLSTVMTVWNGLRAGSCGTGIGYCRASRCLPTTVSPILIHPKLNINHLQVFFGFNPKNLQTLTTLKLKKKTGKPFVSIACRRGMGVAERWPQDSRN